MEERIAGDLDKVEMRELSWVAHRRMMRCVLRGDAAEALRWRRIRLAMDAEEEDVRRFVCQEELVRDHIRERAREAAEREAAARMDSVDSVDENSGPAR